MVMAERALLHRLQGGCQVPIAAHATVNESEIVLDGLVASVDGKEVIRDRVHGTTADPEAAGIQLAERLIGRGADRILQTIYGTAP
jgi:hydroxymethylbilane synthase